MKEPLILGTISIDQNSLLIAAFIVLILAIIIGLVLCIVGVNLKSWLQMNTRTH